MKYVLSLSVLLLSQLAQAGDLCMVEPNAKMTEKQIQTVYEKFTNEDAGDVSHVDAIAACVLVINKEEKVMFLYKMKSGEILLEEAKAPFIGRTYDESFVMGSK